MDKKSSPMRVDKVDKRVLWPVLMGFFIMGFCDIVAPISGRIATEFPASQQAAVSFLPTMVFLWFLVLSTPLAALMNRIGRKAMSMRAAHWAGTSPASGCSVSAIRRSRWRSTPCWRPSCRASG